MQHPRQEIQLLHPASHRSRLSGDTEMTSLSLSSTDGYLELFVQTVRLETSGMGAAPAGLMRHFKCKGEGCTSLIVCLWH